MGARRGGFEPTSPTKAMAEAVVLVVDDGEANVALLERLLLRVGIGRVVGITDPRQAIERYRDLNPDLVLLDLHMPHLDGLAVLDALSGVIPANCFLPVLVLTADVTDGAKQAALAAGAKDFLTKPFDQTEVVLRVKNLLETRALHLALQRHNASLEAELAERAEREHQEAQAHQDRVRRVQAVLAAGALGIAVQPIVDLSTGATVGVEALARFPGPPHRPPNEWFAEAWAAGLGAELELMALRTALAVADRLPPSTYLSLNASPATVLRSELGEILRPHAHRVVLELTEHAAVDAYDRLGSALDNLRTDGVRVAVDDAGAGYASLQHILRIRPDIIKLDIGLTRGIDADPARRALAGSLVTFAAETGATIVAEGIETSEELDALRRLGIRCGQGYHLGRPAPCRWGGRQSAQPSAEALQPAHTGLGLSG